MQTIDTVIGSEVFHRHTEKGFNQLERKLIQDGFYIFSVGVAYPVYIEGVLPTGEWFYFRSRGKSVSLDISDGPTDNEDRTVIQAEIADHLAMNPIEAGLAEELFRELLRIYMAQCHMPVWVKLMLQDINEA